MNHPQPFRRFVPWSALLGAVLVLSSVLSSVAVAQAPGARLILNLDHLAAKASETTDVTLDGSLLKLAGGFLSKKEPDQANVKNLISSLKGIFVRSYEFDKDGQYSEADLAPIRAQLKNPAWSRIVGTENKRNHETSEIYVQTAGSESNGRIVALAIIDAEPRELTVVNIVGPMNLDQLSELGGHMGIPVVSTGAKPNPGGKDKLPPSKNHE